MEGKEGNNLFLSKNNHKNNKLAEIKKKRVLNIDCAVKIVKTVIGWIEKTGRRFSGNNYKVAIEKKNWPQEKLSGKKLQSELWGEFSQSLRREAFIRFYLNKRSVNGKS